MFSSQLDGGNMRNLSRFLSSSLFDEHALSHSPILTPPFFLSLSLCAPPHSCSLPHLSLYRAPQRCCIILRAQSLCGAPVMCRCRMEQPFAFFSPHSQRGWRQLSFLSPAFVPSSVFLFFTLRPFPSVCGLECCATGKGKVAACRMRARVKLCESGRTETERAQLLLVRDFWSPSPLPPGERDRQGTVSDGSEKRRGGDTRGRLMLGAMHHSGNTSGRAKALSQETGKSSAEPCVCVFCVRESAT